MQIGDNEFDLSSNVRDDTSASQNFRETNVDHTISAEYILFPQWNKYGKNV